MDEKKYDSDCAGVKDPIELPPDLKAMMDEYEKNGMGRLIELGLLDKDGYFIECDDDRWKKLLESDDD